ncbi:HAD family hydrolase [Parasphingorhabdus cellanae]|uniref:HAD family phosphatase n=1 Tax=Parasphingorhabdus cellanae TaxID=2806553 RepID=A0ABX7TAM8_9SPHN|nr:HAD-IB family phosphatase [Parasphingorhabdus cellanae]QTD57779.1 HAD family phosphatase [Parasphingorhabdus cellanae]
MTKLAIYDMDRTITIRGTYTPFLLHMVFARAPWRLALLPLLPFGFIGYGLKLISRKTLKTYNQRLLLGSKPSIKKLEPHIERYADKVMRANSYAKAIGQVEADRAEGRKLVLATASYELYVNAIAARLGFDDVIATRLKIDEQGQVLPEIIGENCYDVAKLDRIKTFLDDQGLTRDNIHIRAYSDHVSDAPMLEFADEAVATTPSAPLRALAKRRGWKILDWA